MNPDTNRESTTISTLMQRETIISVTIPILALFAAGIIFTVISDRTLAVVLLCVIAIIAFVASLVFNNRIQHIIRERLNNLADVCHDYVGGDRAVRVVVNGDDEFASLSTAINTMLDNQGNAVHSVGVASNDAAALQAQIEKLLQEVSAVGDGDLRVQAEVTPDTLGVLADSFNYMIEELAKVVGRVQSTAVQVTNATRRILDRSAELAANSETQVKQISQTTDAVEALASFIQNVARNAQSSVEAAQDALKNAATGQLAVRQTIEGMMVIRENVQDTAKKIKRLGERSNEIGEIVRIIEDIADQTNLLALNAAIQSAMAGEHGRGFAVVADEIRLLAERSTESTKRIATLVKSIQGDTYEAVVAMEDSTQEVVKGSQLADDAGRSLNSIYTAVERQAKMIEDIARAANEQTTVSDAVAVAMSRISEITRLTDAGTQEAAVSVSYLAELSEQLRASVSTFRLPDRANDVFGPFASVSSVSDVSDIIGNQNYPVTPLPSQTRSVSGADFAWSGMGGGSNFPPLHEPSNTGSLLQFNPSLSTSSHSSGQPDFGRLSTFSTNGGSYHSSSPLGANQGQASFSGALPMGASQGQASFSGAGPMGAGQGQASFPGGAPMGAGQGQASFSGSLPMGANQGQASFPGVAPMGANQGQASFSGVAPMGANQGQASFSGAGPMGANQGQAGFSGTAPMGANQGQASFSGVPSFGSFGNFSENSNQALFAGQQNFGEMEDNQFNFHTNFSDFSFGTSSGYEPGSQAQPLSNTGGVNGAPQFFGQSSNARQRWQNLPQKDQNQ